MALKSFMNSNRTSLGVFATDFFYKISNQSFLYEKLKSNIYYLYSMKFKISKIKYVSWIKVGLHNWMSHNIWDKGGIVYSFGKFPKDTFFHILGNFLIQ